jgi:transcriptional regulator with XRE-family HTH domain
MTAKMDVRRKARAPRRKIAPPAPKDGELKTGSLAPQSAASRSIAESIGAQVRSLRRKLDLTGTELAVQAGLSAGMLSKIENGVVSASIESLEALSRALNVPLTNFFASYEEQRDCSYVLGGKGVTIARRGTKAGHQYQLLAHLRRDRGRALPHHPHRGSHALHHVPACGRRVHLHADWTRALSPRRQGLSACPCDALFFDAAALHGPEELTKLPRTHLSIIIPAQLRASSRAYWRAPRV